MIFDIVQIIFLIISYSEVYVSTGIVFKNYLFHFIMVNIIINYIEKYTAI
jgi:hypothetical protein